METFVIVGVVVLLGLWGWKIDRDFKFLERKVMAHEEWLVEALMCINLDPDEERPGTLYSYFSKIATTPSELRDFMFPELKGQRLEPEEVRAKFDEFSEEELFDLGKEYKGAIQRWDSDRNDLWRKIREGVRIKIGSYARESRPGNTTETGQLRYNRRHMNKQVLEGLLRSYQ